MKNYCRNCREETSLHESGICPWCDTPLTAKTGTTAALSDDQLRILRQLKERGYTVKDIAESNWQAWGYANVYSCRRSISSGWKRLDLLTCSRAHHAKTDLNVRDRADQLVTSRSQPEKTGA